MTTKPQKEKITKCFCTFHSNALQNIIFLFFILIFASCNKSNNKLDTVLKENQDLKLEILQQRNKIDSLDRLLKKDKEIQITENNKNDNINNSEKPNTNQENITTQNKEEIMGEDKIKELIKKQNPSFDMIESSILDYVGKKMILNGYVKLSNLYFEKYSGLEKNYYCINMLDNNIMSGGPIFVYFPKKGNNKLFELVGMKKGCVAMKIEGIMKKNMIDYDVPRHTPAFEGLTWKVLK
jgi:hypothetical protein